MAGGRPLRIDWLPDDTVEALQAAASKERDAQVATQLHALWRPRQGEPLRATARVLGVSERTLQLWVAWYRYGGLTEIRAHRLARPGRVSRLSPEQEAAVREHLASGAVHTAWDALEWIQTSFGVTYQPKGIYSLLQRLQAKPKVPRPASPIIIMGGQCAGARAGRRVQAMRTHECSEAEKLTAVPGVIYVDGPAGRRAHLAGTGLDVFEVVRIYKKAQGDRAPLAPAYH